MIDELNLAGFVWNDQFWIFNININTGLTIAMKIFLWKHFMNPLIAGFFFALGHFIIYFLTKTKLIKSLESYIIEDTTPKINTNLATPNLKKTKAN